MYTTHRFFTIFLAVILLSGGCDEKNQAKPEITQETCEAIQDAEDCVRAGCTKVCDVVFYGQRGDGILDCQARRHASACLAVVPWSSVDHFNDLNSGGIGDEEVWLCKGEHFPVIGTQTACFRFRNESGEPVVVLGYSRGDTDFPDTDPCLRWDSDESRFPWEGSCETDWWSESMWDDVLPE